MLRRIVLGLVSLVLAAVLYVAIGLFLAKRAIVRIAPPLPSAEDVMDFDPTADLPVKLSYWNTADQKVPRSAVLEAKLDPNPTAPYVLGLPSFVLEWADGRIFLVDLGMDPAAAKDFGRPSELLIGASPMQTHGSIAEKLGAALERVGGISFTHEHTDHTEGVTELCRLHPGPIPVYLGRLWSEESNYTTRPGLRLLDAAKCLDQRTVEGGPLLGIRGFPGLSFFAAAGHTPGSQVFVAHVRTGDSVKTWILAGDIANNIDGIRHNVPKPRMYSVLLVPEATQRLDTLRRFLQELERDHGATVLVAHDLLALQASGIPSL
ncbi:MAG TPA: MBL fold metallo-hydrolase [Myxococcota bacterium]|nr:MBL fold metallo-hydrolase [Myxococcota bacterium]